MADAPRKADRYQRFMLVIAISLIFEADVGLVGSRCLADRPVLMNPAAVCRECQRRRQQPLEGPVDAVLVDVAAPCRVVKLTVEREDGLVGDRRIVE